MHNGGTVLNILHWEDKKRIGFEQSIRSRIIGGYEVVKGGKSRPVEKVDNDHT